MGAVATAGELGAVTAGVEVRAATDSVGAGGAWELSIVGLVVEVLEPAETVEDVGALGTAGVVAWAESRDKSSANSWILSNPSYSRKNKR